MEKSVKKTLVIGMGNVLMQDEGIGVRAVEELVNRYHIPTGVEVVDGGTTGMELFEPMRQADNLIIADAVNTGAPYGSLVRIANHEIPAFFQTKLSNHQLGVSDLLALLTLKGETPEQVTIVGMVPHSLENRLGSDSRGRGGTAGHGADAGGRVGFAGHSTRIPLPGTQWALETGGRVRGRSGFGRMK